MSHCMLEVLHQRISISQLIAGLNVQAPTVYDFYQDRSSCTPNLTHEPSLWAFLESSNVSIKRKQNILKTS